MATAAPAEASVSSGQLPAGFEALAAEENHPLFATARVEEVRPGRSLYVLASPRQGARATLFFVHGSAANCTQYEFLLAHFARDYTVVAFDAAGARPPALASGVPPRWKSQRARGVPVRGHAAAAAAGAALAQFMPAAAAHTRRAAGCGASPVPEAWDAYSHASMMEDLKAVYRRYAGAVNVVIGHSYGASLVAQLAAAAANQTAAAGTDDTLPQPAGIVLLGPAMAPDYVPAAAPIFALPLWLLELIRPWLRSSFASRALSEETRAEGTPVARRVMARLRAVEGKNPMRMLQAFYTQWRWVTRDEVGTLGGVRALVATGAEDRLTPPAWAEAVRQAIPSAAGDDETAHVVQGAGHQVMQEQPQHTIQLIESFLRRVLQ